MMNETIKDKTNDAASGQNEPVVMCEGGECCENGHEGEVKSVNVTHTNSKHDWGNFNYCDNAIKEDRRMGLTVTILVT